MRLTPPKKNTFYGSVALAALGLLGSIIAIPVVSDFAFWFVLVAFVVLAAGNAMKGF